MLNVFSLSIEINLIRLRKRKDIYCVKHILKIFDPSVIYTVFKINLFILIGG